MKQVLDIPKALKALDHNQPSRPVSPLQIEPKNEISDRNEDTECHEKSSGIGQLPVHREEARGIGYTH